MLADGLSKMISDLADDADAPAVNIASLRDMASCMLEHVDYDDPFVGPNATGIVSAEWRFNNNGVLLLSFLGHGQVILVAQDDGGLDVGANGQLDRLLEEHSHLVPKRRP